MVKHKKSSNTNNSHTILIISTRNLLLYSNTQIQYLQSFYQKIGILDKRLHVRRSKEWSNTKNRQTQTIRTQFK